MAELLETANVNLVLRSAQDSRHEHYDTHKVRPRRRCGLEGGQRGRTRAGGTGRI